MSEPSSPREKPEEIADANLLFDDQESLPSRNEPRPSTPASETPQGYEIEGEVPDDDFVPAPVPRVPIAPAGRKKERREPKPDPIEHDDEPLEPVLTVWSRWGEWGPTLTILGSIAAGTLVFLYFFGGAAGWSGSFVLLLVAGVVMIALSYPIAITLERPTRMTPEQAIKDYFGALSHHYPAYRRMWLLLSEKGRMDREFGSFGDFRATMLRRLNELRGSQVKPSTPLMFEVENFKSEKSGGLKRIDVSYTLRVFARGGDKTIASFPIKTSLVRGPDSMWYLNSGSIPRET